MKKIFLLILFFSLGFSAFSQPWMKNLPKNKSKTQLTLFDYRNAFDQYWSSYKVKNGVYKQNGVTKKASGWKQFNRWYYNWEPRVNKYGNFPNISALEMYNLNASKKPASQSPKTANWTKLGPKTSSGGYSGIGRISCIAFHPSDNSTYWIGAPAGGIWKTSDNGSTWNCLTNMTDVLGVSDIAVTSDYSSSQTIYIATGDRDAHDNYSVGVLKSTDGGTNWFYTGLKFNLNELELVNRILIDPMNNNNLIAATSSGIFRTTDAGTTWINVNSSEFIDLEYKPGNSEVIYASNKSGDIYISTNGGLDWTQVLNTSGERVELAITPANSNVIYALITGSDNGLYGIYKSTNGGISFSEIFSGSTKNLLGWYSGGNDDQGGQGWYDLSLAVSPSDDKTVLVGGINTWRSSDGGISWSLIAHWSGNGAPAVHADVHSISYRSNGTVFETNDGGVYISDNDGTNFTDKTNGIIHSQIYKLSVSQTEQNEIIAGLQDNGTKLYSNSYWFDKKGGDGMECIIDYSDKNIQYASTYYGEISRTDNHWTSRTDIKPSGEKGAWVTPYVIDPNDHNVIFAGYNDVWKSTYRGNSWTKISSFNISSTIRNIAIAPSNSAYIYASDPYNIWKTTDGGSSWNKISSSLPSNFITYLTVKDDDPNTIWVTLGSYDKNAIYESTDGGTSWTNISAGLPEIPAYTVVQNKQVTNEVNLYIGTELGVYFKHGKSDWIPYNTNLPNVKIGELEIYYNSTPANSLLRAATYGRGLWESPLNYNEVYTPSVDSYDATNLTQTSATLNGEILNDYGDNITESGFVYSLTSNPEIGANGTINITTGTTSGTFTSNISGLNPSNIYYFKAYSINSKGVGYGPEKTFSTTCGIISSFPYNQGFNINSTPDCWTEEVVTNTGTSASPSLTYVSSTNYPTASAFEGAGFVSFNSYDCEEGDEIRLYSPAINTNGIAKISVNFEWFQSSNYKTYNDAVIIQYSTDGTNWTNVQTILRTGDISEWINKNIELPESATNQSTLYVGLLFHSDWGYNCHLDNLLIIAEDITANISATSGCNAGTGIITVGSNTTANQTFYLRDDSGASIDSWTGTASSHDFTALNDGTYRAQVELNGNISTLSNNVVLTNSLSAPTTPTNVSVNNSEICGGATVTLSYSGGSGDTFNWYSDASFSTKVGEGNNLLVSPADTTTYYGRWENGCGVSTEKNTIVNAIPKTKITTEPSNRNVDVLDSTAFIVKCSGANLVYDWRYNGEKILSSNNDTLIINPVQGYSEGFYTVKITGTCGEAISKQVFLGVNGTSISENKNIDINIFPNPTQGIVNIKLPYSSEKTSIYVFTIDGKKVFTRKINKKEVIIDLSSLSRGSYIIEVLNNNFNIRKTILLK